MNKDLRIGRKFLCLVIALVMVMTLIPRLPASFAYAEAGETPDHAKILQVNEDGTYTIALDVTGDAERKPNPVNVIVIIDRSGSMDEPTGNTEVTYSPTTSTGGWNYQNNLYGLIDGEYRQLTRTNSGSWQNPQYHFWYNNQEYTGQRYTRQTANQDRLEAAQEAANQLASALLAHNGQDGNADDTVEISLVSFSTHATTNVAPTTTYSTFETGVNALNHTGGTNWEAAFTEASDVDFGDNDPTYVIFLSDGLPTFRDSANGYTGDYDRQNQVYGDGQEGTQNVNRCYAPALTAAQSLLSDAESNTAAERFYTIFAYGGNAGATRLKTLTTDAGAPEANNYSAENTAQLQQAFADILEAIEMAGIGNVDLVDGTTSNVSTSSGTAHLLDVDEDSFKYYRAGGTNEDGSEKYDSDANTITDADGNETNIGEEWTGDEVPKATFENGEVKWDLGEDFILENGVKYTVTFDCWPSQETLDHVASIKNDPNYYSTLDDNIKRYLNEDGTLKTNTSATLSYEDTRTDEAEKDHPIGYENPDPVQTSAVEQLAVTKAWNNKLEDDWDKPEEIVLDVTRDGENTYTATLNEGNEWKDGVYISIGIMRTSGDDVELLTTGHNFTFSEPGAASGYKWELNVPTVRPMKINGTDTILVLADEDHPVPDGATTYTLPDKDGVEGGTYYVDNNIASLTATNERRSSLNLLKVVDGEDAPEDAVFPFTLNIVDSLAPETAPTDDPDHESDYWVWISVRDNGTPVTDAVVSGATHAGSGWYYGVSGQDIVLNVKDGYSIRLNNLPVDSEYTITEGDLTGDLEGFVFDGAEIKIIDGVGTETDSFAVDEDAQKASGKIQETNTLYQVTMNNKYELTDIEITKKWVDGSNQDGIRPTAAKFAELLTLSPAVEGKTPTVVDNGDNTYTVTYTGLPRYIDAEEVEYTVTEAAIEGYTTTGDNPAKDHGTITNTHETEVTSVDVEKVWEGPAGDAVTVTLYADNKATDKTLTLNAQNQWKGTFEDLPAYAAGEKIVYTVVEEGVSGVDATKYTTTITGDAENGFTITNTNTETVDVTATKVWDDASDQDGLRPETLELTLNGLPEGTTAPTPTVTKSTDGNSWTYTWTGLPKYDNSSTSADPISYTVTEGTVPTGYTCETTTVAAGGTITNVHTPEVVDVSVEKVWDDADDQDGIRPASIGVTLLADGDEVETVTLTENADKKWTATVSGLPKNADGKEIVYTWTEKLVPDGYTCETPTVAAGGTITNKHTPEQTEATVKKDWKDANDQDGFRPDDLTVKLLANGEDTGKTVTLSESNNWTATIDELDKYAAGAEISYTWDEGTIEKYTLSKTEKAGTVTTLTNEHAPEKVEVEVEKVWDDENNQDGIRPESVTIKLLADGEDTGKTVTLNEENEWKGKFEALDKYANGEEIEYTVEEVEVTGYEADVTGNASAESEAIGYIVTNVHEPEVVTIPVEKVWKDADDQDGYRPDSVTISLLADGVDTGHTVSLNEANEWKNTFEGADLYKYAVGKEGVPVVYTIKELEVKEYTVAISGTVADGYTVTNSHTPEVVKVSVEKVWDDADDRDGIRPDSVTVTLLADGDDVTQEGITATVELNEKNNWKYTWEGLNKRAAGQEISYTVEEAPIDNYEAEITGDAKDGYTIKNFHLADPVPVMSDPPVKKVVKGNPSKDETFTFQMKAKTEGAPMPEGAKDGVLTMDIVGSGEKEFGEMWFDKAGTYVYEITEVDTKAANYKYDSTAYTLTVEVKEVADGTQVKLVKTETVTGGNGQIVFTNTYEEPPVKTGDTTIVVPYIVIGASALILLLMLLFRTRKNRA